jgi:hypothetical protein
VRKEKRHKAVINSEKPASSFDVILEESRSLRRQMANDLSNEARQFRRMSRHFARPPYPTDPPDEQSA